MCVHFRNHDSPLTLAKPLVFYKTDRYLDTYLVYTSVHAASRLSNLADSCENARIPHHLLGENHGYLIQTLHESDPEPASRSTRCP